MEALLSAYRVGARVAWRPGIIAGRAFTEAETEGNAPVAIVNDALAARLEQLGRRDVRQDSVPTLGAGLSRT